MNLISPISITLTINEREFLNYINRIDLAPTYAIVRPEETWQIVYLIACGFALVAAAILISL